MNLDEDRYKLAHARCFELTGDEWCPYMSELFMDVILKVNDDIARELIEERRTYLFPHFLVGEPQQDKLTVYI